MIDVFEVLLEPLVDQLALIGAAFSTFHGEPNEASLVAPTGTQVHCYVYLGTYSSDGPGLMGATDANMTARIVAIRAAPEADGPFLATAQEVAARDMWASCKQIGDKVIAFSNPSALGDLAVVECVVFEAVSTRQMIAVLDVRATGLAPIS